MATPCWSKGRVVKVVDKTTHRDDHDPDTLVERFRDRYVTTVATLSATHGLEIIQDTERLTDFMKAHGDKIAAHTLAAYQPLYDLKPTEEELAILDRLGKQRKPLPGQAEAGLLPTQKHAAIAAARAIRSHRTANVQGEMGVRQDDHRPGGHRAAGRLSGLDLVPAAPGAQVDPRGGRCHPRRESA